MLNSLFNFFIALTLVKTSYTRHSLFLESYEICNPGLEPYLGKKNEAYKEHVGDNKHIWNLEWELDNSTVSTVLSFLIL